MTCRITEDALGLLSGAERIKKKAASGGASLKKAFKGF